MSGFIISIIIIKISISCVHTLKKTIEGQEVFSTYSFSIHKKYVLLWIYKTKLKTVELLYKRNRVFWPQTQTFTFKLNLAESHGHPTQPAVK